MAVLFDGRIDTTAGGPATGGKSFADYNRFDRDPVSGTIPPLADGDPGSYEYAYNIGGHDRVAKIIAPAENPGRCELRPYQTDPVSAGPVYGERWYWWSTYLPADWVIDYSQSVDVASSLIPNGRVIIGQVHETSDAGDTVHFPPFQLYVTADRYEIALTADANATTVARAPGLKVLRSWPVQLGVWVDWVLHAKWAADNNGFLHFYKDRRLEYSLTGAPTTYNDAAGLFMKAGVYAYSNASSPAVRTLYSRGIVIGDASSSHAEVSGKSLLDRRAIRGAR